MAKFFVTLPDRFCKVCVRVDFPRTEDQKAELYQSGVFELLPGDQARLDLSFLFRESRKVDRLPHFVAGDSVNPFVEVSGEYNEVHLDV